jgi:hypothetical protein
MGAMYQTRLFGHRPGNTLSAMAAPQSDRLEFLGRRVRDFICVRLDSVNGNDLSARTLKL